MDRNQFIGLVLIFVLTFVYFQYIAPPPEEIALSDTTQVETPEATASDSAPAADEQLIPTAFSQLQNDSLPTQEIVFENEVLRIQMSSRGGYPQSVELKHYKTYAGEPLFLLVPQYQKRRFIVNTRHGALDLSQLHYSVKKQDKQELVLEAILGEGKRIVQTYRFRQDVPYLLDYSLRSEGLEQDLLAGIAFDWQASMLNTEKDVTLSRSKATVNYYTTEGGFDGLNEMSSEAKEESIASPIVWTSFKQQFFSAAIIHPAASFQKAQLFVAPPADENSSIVKHYGMRWESAQKLSSLDFQLFFGPNKVPILSKVGYDFEKNVYLGWSLFRWINRYIIIPIFNFLEQFIDNYGLIIILLVLIIKTALFPLTYRSYIGMGKMKVLQPEIQALKEKYSDPQELQMAQMELFRQVGVNPLSGCLPMLLQMPILFAMFMFFPNAIELRQKAFLWAEDLSTYDSILNLPFNIPFYGDHVSLFTLLMTLSSIAYAYYSSQNTASSQAGPMQYMGYFMPIVFMFVLNSYPSGLSFYYFCSNIITIGQQLIIRRFVDDEKILAILEENKKKQKNGGKQSSFQKRLEEAMRKAQQAKKK
ncbi:YidC/Oxa1 family membrane protein insertase [Thermonema lapsum]|uniref:Membrane protein insertase YidC n=1 Tax=Thermonema lapsum TaxID=28195 RepID=A0A846MNE9_9BACT|nr:membrane protein insertase YidC [Thermonema lapsum]NIK73098.1 YidC/Oxa1 family membrane protein insertase [Thermonema lapsum]